MTPTSSTRTAVGLALLATLGITLTYLLAVRTRTGQLLDTQAMLAVAELLAGTAWAEVILIFVSPMTVLIGAASLAAAAGAVGGARPMGVVMMTTLGTTAMSVALKAVLVRPQLVDGAANSLPSGHVAAVAGLAAAAVVTTPPRLRLVVSASGLAMVALTGLATLALAWHRPSDVIASALLAVAVAALGVALAPGGWVCARRGASAETVHDGGTELEQHRCGSDHQ